MPFNGAGVYSAPAADFPAVTQTVISSTHFNNVVNDIATGLSLCLTKDGQQTATANIPFGGFRATNVGITGIAGSVGTPAINVSDTGTGLYRSAASELAVTVAGTQRGRFDSTGLIVTGVGTFSGVVTATTSVVTPLIQSSGAVDLVFGANSGTDWNIAATGKHWLPGADNTQNIGSATKRIANLFTSTIDSGTSGSLSLKTNNGTEQVRVVHAATAVNFLSLQGAAAGAGPNLLVGGTDTDIPFNLGTRGAGALNFFTRTDVASKQQFAITDTALSSRWITVTGSNGGDPTLSTSAGNLNLNSVGGSLKFNAVDLTPTTSTWTPVLAFGGLSIGITYTVQSGGYSKIGNLVIAWFKMTLSSKGSSVGNATIGGLPFTSANVGYDEGAAGSLFWQTMNSTLVSMEARLPANSTTINLYGLASSNVSMVAVADTQFANTTTLAATIIYQV